MENINRNSILKEMQDMAWHNVLCYSKNYAMSEPRDGRRAEWERALAKAEIIEQMFDELPAPYYCEPHKCTRCERKFTGFLDAGDWARWRLDFVEIQIAGVGGGAGDCDKRALFVGTECSEYLLSGRYEKERRARRDERKSELVRVTADRDNRIQKIEWAD
jgi:hypothetical protein